MSDRLSDRRTFPSLLHAEALGLALLGAALAAADRAHSWAAAATASHRS